MMLSSNSSCCNIIPLFPENDSFFTTSPYFYFDDHQYHFCLDLFCAHHHHHHTAMPPLSNHSSVVKPTKKDRHSKINTARGPRDRRMRLSLEIARKFFDLQDMLGYDKASRTVEWLLTSSGDAIKELARAQNPSSDHSSTCEQERRPPSSKSRARREKVKRVVGRATVGKESRTKARERARERTSQKRRLINISDELKVQSTGASESLPFAFNHAADHLQPPPPPWNPAAGFSYHAGQNAAFLNQEDEEIGEFEFSGKAWEDFNAFNLSG